MNRFFVLSSLLVLLVPSVGITATGHDLDFEGPFPPPGVDLIESAPGNGWEGTSIRALSGTRSSMVFFGPIGVIKDEWLVLPEVDASTFTEFVVQFHETQIDWSFGDRHEIAVSTTSRTNPADFTVIFSMTPGNHSIGDNFQFQEFDLNPFIGEPQVHVAFRYVAENGDAWIIDDVFVGQPTQHDVGVVDRGFRELPYKAGETVVVEVAVGNFGRQSASFDINLAITEFGGTVFSETQSVSDLGPGSTFARKFNWSPEDYGWFRCIATVDLSVDEIPGNDEFQWDVDVYSQDRRALSILTTNSDVPEEDPIWAHFKELLENRLAEFSLINAHKGDGFHADNPVQNEFLSNLHHAWAPTPDWVGDNVFPLDRVVEEAGYFEWGFVPPLWEVWTTSSGSPLNMETNFQPFVSGPEGQVIVTLDIVDPLKPGLDYYLYGAITEDDADGSGFNDTFRILLPGQSGVLVSHDLGPTDYYLDYGPTENWVEENIKVQLFVIEGPHGQFGRILDSAVWTPVEPVSAVRGENPPTATRLLGAYPNPFNPSTTLSFEMAAAGSARLAVYDVAGRLVTTLVDDHRDAGRFDVVWDGRDTAGRMSAAGVYLYRLEAGGVVESRRMMLVK